LLLGAALLLALMPATATAQRGVPDRSDELEGAPQAERVPSTFVNQWTVTAGINYSDNFARLPEGPVERRFVLPNGSLLGIPVLTPDGEIAFVPTTDTVEIEPEGRAFATLSMQGSSAVFRPRLQAILQGGVTVGHYLDDASLAEIYEEEASANLPQVAVDAGAEGTIGDLNLRQTFIDPNLTGFSALELVEDRVFFEAGGFLQEQALFAFNQLGAQVPGNDANEIIIGGLFLSPVYVQSFAYDQEFELRYRNSSIFVLDELPSDPTLDGPGRGQLLNDSKSNEVRIAYRTGDIMGPVEATVVGFGRHFEEEGGELAPSQTIEQLSGGLTLNYDVSRRFALEASAGYDDIDSSFEEAEFADFPGRRLNDNGLSGVYYSMGVRYEPNTETSLFLAVGERYGGTLIESDVRTSLTSRIRLTATARRNITSGLQDQQAGALQLNSRTLNLVESLSRQSERLSEKDILQRLQASIGQVGNFGAARVGIFPATNISANLQGDFGRTGANLGVAVTLIDGGDGDGEGGGQRNNRFGGGRGDQYRVSAGVNRALTRRLNAGVTAAYIRSEGGNLFLAGAEGVEEQRYGANLTYQIGPAIGMRLGVQRLQREAEGLEGTPSLFRGIGFEFEENQVNAGLSWTF
jgi:hypothetical protein